MPETAVLLTEELDVLQELMNMAFGKAGADVAAGMDLGVGLTVPAAQVMPAVLLRYYVGAELKGEGRVAVLEQGFQGELEGSAFLVLPEAVGGEKLRTMGAVLVRACVERLAELLGTRVKFDEPRLAVEGRKEAAARADVFQGQEPAVVLANTFHLDAPPVTGHLFLAAGASSMRWLQAALERFMKRYA